MDRTNSFVKYFDAAGMAPKGVLPPLEKGRNVYAATQKEKRADAGAPSPLWPRYPGPVPNSP